MCITFFYINPDPKLGKYSLILVMNRDEFINRPTQQANWRNGILAGRDMEIGKEGGTWLAMDEKGRLAILTNVYTGKPIKSSGRGFIVIDYLRGNKSANQYLSDLSHSDIMYSPFNLCIFEPQANHGYEAMYFKNTFKDESNGVVIQGDGPKLLSPGVSGFGNHPISEPYRKTTFGIDAFKNIVERYLDDDNLVEEIIKLMSNREHMYPDKQMQKQSGLEKTCLLAENESEEIKWMLDKEKLLSSIFVDMGDTYGTRMQTLIFVDFKHNVKFVERTRSSNTPLKWDVKTFNFQFH